jgi:hypothetical protein
MGRLRFFGQEEVDSWQQTSQVFSPRAATRQRSRTEFASDLPIEASQKQELLELLNPAKRLEKLLGHLSGPLGPRALSFYQRGQLSLSMLVERPWRAQVALLSEKRKAKTKATHHVRIELAIAELRARLPPGDR